MAKALTAVIVASGPSARGFVPPAGVLVIAVNGAIDWLARADYFFTLDPSQENVKRMRNQRHGVNYNIALPEGGPLPAPKVNRWLRVSGRGSEPEQKGSPDWWLWRLGAVLGLCTHMGSIHTGNSAWGALGMAYHLGATKVALVGVDANAEPRVEGGRSRDLSHLPILFESAIKQMDIVNCGAMRSRVPAMTIEEGMQWLRAGRSTELN